MPKLKLTVIHKHKWKFCIDRGCFICDEMCRNSILKPELYPECNNKICIKAFAKNPKKYILKININKKQKLQIKKSERLKLSVKSQRPKLRIKS